MDPNVGQFSFELRFVSIRMSVCANSHVGLYIESYVGLFRVLCRFVSISWLVCMSNHMSIFFGLDSTDSYLIKLMFSN